MRDRVLTFVSPSYLSIYHAQLQITCQKTGEITCEPLDNVGFIILESSRITLTKSVLEHAAEHNIAVVICDKKHLPLSLALPYRSNSAATKVIRAQIQSSLPFRKILWKKIITQKIINQCLVLESVKSPTSVTKKLRELAKKVKSGDPESIEAQAAKNYFQPLFGQFFRRTPNNNDYINNCLDYGYTIMRSAVARELVSSGLLPLISIQHKNQYNAHPLADDLIEPFRPAVDKLVYDMKKYQKDRTQHNLTRNDKDELCQILFKKYATKKGKYTLIYSIRKSSSSLAKAFLAKDPSLFITHNL